jgi:hypothetical protein
VKIFPTNCFISSHSRDNSLLHLQFCQVITLIVYKMMERFLNNEQLSSSICLKIHVTDILTTSLSDIQYHNPEKNRRNGKCPLTPEEVGIMLRALGYGKDTNLYVASGEVYNGEASLAPLKALFPNFYTKDTISDKTELLPFTGFSSRMAAIDYIVCSQSDVFVANNNGNMARILAGERLVVLSLYGGNCLGNCSC